MRSRCRKGTLIIRAAEQLGRADPALLRPPAALAGRAPAGSAWSRSPTWATAAACPSRPRPARSRSCRAWSIKTQLTSPVADKAQQGIMEMLLINHPLDCPVCDKGGECPLQNQAMSNGRAESRFHDIKRTFAKPIAVSSNVLLDRERCVLCQRCTRFSEEIAGDPFIDMLERGPQQQVGTSADTPFHSYFSGNTVQICPVGALTGASYRFRARPFDLLSTDTTCEHCASGLLAAGRLAPRQGHPPAGRQRPRRQRGMELRQGPLGVPLRRAGRPAADPDGAQRGRRAGRGELARRARAGGRRACARLATATASACCRAGGSPKRTPTPTPSSPGSRSAPTTSTTARARPPTRSWPSSARTSPA